MEVGVHRGGTGDAGFEVARAPIPPRLAPFVSSWLGYREWSPTRVERLEVPLARAVLIFEYGVPIAVGRPAAAASQYRGGFFVGMDDAVSATAFTGTQAGIQVDLTPRGAHAFAGRDLAGLTRHVADLTDMGVPRSFSARLAEARTWGERFALVLRVLAARFDAAVEPSLAVRWAVERIDAHRGALRIDALSEELGFSRKHLHERFVREVGLPPKRYAALRRFDHVVQELRAGTRVNLARLAADAGYADQAHLAREVRRFSGRTATELALSLRGPLAETLHSPTS